MLINLRIDWIIRNGRVRRMRFSFADNLLCIVEKESWEEDLQNKNIRSVILFKSEVFKCELNYQSTVKRDGIQPGT